MLKPSPSICWWDVLGVVNGMEKLSCCFGQKGGPITGAGSPAASSFNPLHINSWSLTNALGSINNSTNEIMLLKKKKNAIFNNMIILMDLTFSFLDLNKQTNSPVHLLPFLLMSSLKLQTDCSSSGGGTMTHRLQVVCGRWPRGCKGWTWSSCSFAPWRRKGCWGPGHTQQCWARKPCL